MDRARAFTYIGVMSTSNASSKGNLGGLCGLIRNPGLYLLTLFRGKFVGRDTVGNQYFERPGHGAGVRARRWVVYAGKPEASTVPATWHAWLHHLTDAPLPETGAKPWQLPHQANLTGTPASYHPAGTSARPYQAWTPDQA